MRSQASAGGVAVVKEDHQQHGTEEEREVEDTEPEIKVQGVAGKPMEATAVEDKPESSLTNIKRSKRYMYIYFNCTYTKLYIDLWTIQATHTEILYSCIYFSRSDNAALHLHATCIVLYNPHKHVYIQ